MLRFDRDRDIGEEQEIWPHEFKSKPTKRAKTTRTGLGRAATPRTWNETGIAVSPGGRTLINRTTVEYSSLQCGGRGKTGERIGCMTRMMK
jgi:hypothetical protein